MLQRGVGWSLKLGIFEEARGRGGLFLNWGRGSFSVGLWSGCGGPTFGLRFAIAMKPTLTRRLLTRLLAVFILSVLAVVAYFVLKSTGTFGGIESGSVGALVCAGLGGGRGVV